MTPAKPKLTAIQALRGVASVSVICYHASRHVDQTYGTPLLRRVFLSSHAGVDLFFAISGFIILFVHANDIGRPARLGHYAERRFTRVLPLYWVALALTVLMAVAAHNHLDPLWLAWNTTLLPTAHAPFMMIAWTLQYEIVFYAVFATLILNRRAGLAVIACWVAVVVAAPIIGIALPSGLTGFYMAEFLLGMGAAIVVRGNLARSPVALAACGAGLFIGLMVAESAGLLSGHAWYSPLVYGGPAAMTVAGVAAAEQRDRLALPVWLVALGEASYSLYLFQIIFIAIGWQVWSHAGLARFLPADACFLLLVAVAVAGGVLMSRIVERPLLRLSRSIVGGHKQKQAVLS
jgi:peptidoglycan/LPS O-acetylase OafA/YrhL